jgi:hypothetical protein
MREFKLKQSFAGKKKGEILKFDKTLDWKYKGAAIIVTEKSELLEVIPIEEQKPLVFTNENELYYNGNRFAIFHGDEYFFISPSDYTIIEATKGDRSNSYFSSSLKRFKTLEAAKDWNNLQRIIKNSKLKIGDTLIGKSNFKFSRSNDRFFRNFNSINKQSIPRIITKFIIFNNTPCCQYRRAMSEVLFAPLDQFITKKEK